MNNLEDFSDNLNHDIHKLSSERSSRFNRYRNRNIKRPEKINIELNFTLTNTFWGNSWSCAEKLEVIKGKAIKTSINIISSNSISEVWDCRIDHYNSVDDHDISLKSLDNSISIQIINNKFTCSGTPNHAVEGFVSEEILSENK
jgi:hypothetical protein